MNQIPKIEKKILKFWKRAKIFEKSLKKNKGKKSFVFFEGPPGANGRPGIHHVEARVFKDIIPRYKTMRGFYVDRKAGWDTHGLPVELEVEKELGFKNKEDIEKYGIAKFNQKCKQSVWRYKNDWESLTKRIGYWVDMNDPYITYENSYIESIWYIIKKIWNKGLLFKDFKIVHHCPRCGTSLSSHEVAQGYKKVKEISVYLNFKIIKGNDKVKPNDIILAWTTTPWTLPGNVALAAGKNIKYVKIKHQGKYYILAKKRLEIIDGDYQIETELKGEDLNGLEYQPLFEINLIKNSGKKSHYVALADFVSAEDGTGIVHTAVMYGEDDYNLGDKLDLPKAHTVDERGFFIRDLADYNLAGKFVKDKNTERIILDYLKNKDTLFKEELIEHDYPFCWRCHTPLLYYAKDSWFVKMSALRKNLIANNQKINWEPAHIKNGRFGEFIKEARDWALSRERYWGTPLPIWKCQKCGQMKCIGSIKELEKPVKDLHRPYIDAIKLKCQCKAQMIREKDVLDVWFDSGAMPFAQWGYPYQKDSGKKFKEHYPADFISEAVDQTRGWFYTLLAVSTLMQYCGEIKAGFCYKNVICLGHVLDAQGKKMSKSLGNVVDPWEICEQFGADVLRWYLYTINQAGEPKRFDIKDLADKNRRFFGTLLNSLIFWQTYKSTGHMVKSAGSKNILDKWIISKFNSLNNLVIEHLEKYDVVSAARLIENFVEDFSNWYIRRSRRRFQKPVSPSEKKEAEKVYSFILINLAKLSAPFIPFISEEIYQQVSRYLESVHLEGYPRPDKKRIDNDLEKKMLEVRQIAAIALAQRAQAGLKVRQPLLELRIKNKELSENKDLMDLIKEEINVKKVVWDSKIEGVAKLNIKITDGLRNEGMIRDLVRTVQDMRKDAQLRPGQMIYLRYSGDSFLNQIIQKQIQEIKKEVWADKIEVGLKKKEVFLIEREFVLAGRKLWLGVKK